MTRFFIKHKYQRIFSYILKFCLRHGIVDTHERRCGRSLEAQVAIAWKNYHRCKVAALMKDTKGWFHNLTAV